jgi:hypothetical protein
VASPTTLTPPPQLDQRLLEPPSHHWRGLVIALAIVLTVVLAVGVVLAFLGMLPWRGPLSTGDAPLAGVSATFDVEAGDRIAYPLLFVANRSRVGVVLDSVVPVDGTPDVRVRDAWLFADTTRCRTQSPSFPYGVPDDCRIPLAGTALPGHQYGDVGTRVIVMLQPTRPGTYRVDGFDVHYHVGPIDYTTTFGDGYVIHAAEPSGGGRRSHAGDGHS